MAEKKYNPLLLWIHCNKCLEIMVMKRKRFGLFTCQHVFCETCIQTFTLNGTKHCAFCKKNISVMEINSSMPINYRRFFQPQPWTNIANFADVIPFQLKHRNHFLNALKKPVAYRLNLLKFKNNLKENCSKLKNKHKEARIIRNQLEKIVENIKLEHRNNSNSHGESFPSNLVTSVHSLSRQRPPSSHLEEHIFTHKDFQNKPDTSNQKFRSKSTPFLQDFSFF